MSPARLLCPGNSPGQNTGVGSHSLLQGIFPTQDRAQVSCIADGFFTAWATQGSPRILAWVAYPFSREFSWPRDQTRVSCIASRFFTSWATREYNLSKILTPYTVCLKIILCKYYCNILQYCYNIIFYINYTFEKQKSGTWGQGALVTPPANTMGSVRNHRSPDQGPPWAEGHCNPSLPTPTLPSPNQRGGQMLPSKWVEIQVREIPRGCLLGVPCLTGSPVAPGCIIPGGAGRGSRGAGGWRGQKPGQH